MESKERIKLLDYLKAICVVMVIVTHYDWADKTSPVFTMGINMAVPVFMILSGYNFAMSNKKKAEGKIRKMYRWEMIRPKLVRFLLPFLFICIVEIALLVEEGKHINLFRIFLFGAYGPGSYYVPVLLQLLVVFPIIYVLVERNAKLGLAAAAVLNLGFEVFVQMTAMEKYYYRLLIGRYLLLIAFGCYLYLHPEQRLRKIHMLIMLAIGLGYIIEVLGFERDPIVFDYWTPTAMPVAFYIFPIIVIVFRRFYHARVDGMVGQVWELLGKASYHIFLIQMVYYHFELGGRLMKLPAIAAVTVNVIICCTVGALFYELECYGLRQMRLIKNIYRRKRYVI